MFSTKLIHPNQEIEYEIEYLTNDDGSLVVGDSKHAEERPLHQGMMPDWSYEDPNS